MKSKYEQYYKVRKYFVVNYGDGYEADPALKPVVFSLPEPPKDWTNIKNYGLHPDEQIYRTDEFPKRLKMLEKEVSAEAEEKFDASRNNTINGYKLLRAFWQKLSDEAEVFQDEIKWMRNVIWKRYYGEWVFIDGQLLWLPPRYYMYINFWSLNVPNGYDLPEFRIRDWKSGCINHYLRHTREGFEKDTLNKKGFTKKIDGKYKVKDIGVRVMYGSIRPKNRRSGATHEALSEAHETVCTGIGKKATTISKSVQDVVEFFDEMLFPSWRRIPLFLKPTWVGAQVSGKKIEYKTQIFGSSSMDSVIYYVNTTDEVVLDSKRLDFILNDEQGKKTGGGRVDVADRYNVSKQTLATGNGASIHGFCMNPSTAEEMEDGAKQYKLMCDHSNFYQRTPNGQTKSGLMLVYFPAQYCLEGFVDCFGKAVVVNPTDRQIRLTEKYFPNRNNTFTKLGVGSKDFLLSSRNMLLASGKPEDLHSYRQIQRKHPMNYDESWIGDSGDMGFPVVKIDARIADTDYSNETLTSYGHFMWTAGFGSNVRWDAGDETDRFEFSYHIKTEFANRKKTVRVWNGISGLWEQQYAPVDPRFILGGDTFGYDNQSVAKGREDKSRKSDGGIGGYYPYDEHIDGGKDRIDWDSDRMILSYRAKPPSSDAYNEDLLMAAIYLGAYIYPERNITNTWEYCIKKGYGGYLKYDINISTGKAEERPGYWLSAGGKEEMFRLLNDYIDRNAFRERHISFLLEAKKIRGPEFLKNEDRLAAHGAALMGARDMSITAIATDRTNRVRDAYKSLGRVL